MKILEIRKDVISTQSKNCFFCVQIGTIAFYILVGLKNIFRLEFLTPLRKFRLS